MYDKKVLQWEMHGEAGEVRFLAAREVQGYSVVVEKDGAMALAGVAPDCVTLLRRSQELRSALQDLGYAPSPMPEGAGQLWRGSQKPLPLSLISILRS